MNKQIEIDIQVTSITKEPERDYFTDYMVAMDMDVGDESLPVPTKSVLIIWAAIALSALITGYFSL